MAGFFISDLSGGASSSSSNVAVAHYGQDATGSTVYVVTLEDGTVSYLDGPGGNTVTPTLPISPTVDDKTREFVNVCMIDDTLNDNTNLVRFQAISLVESDGTPNGTTSTFLGNFTDITASSGYTPLGTVSRCEDLGFDVETALGFEKIIGPTTWSPTVLMTGVNITVVNSLGNITLTDSNGNTETVEEEAINWSISDRTSILDDAPVLTVGAGSVVTITYSFIKQI